MTLVKIGMQPILLLAFLVSIESCSLVKDDKVQKSLHNQLHSYFENSLNDTSSEVEESANRLVECMSAPENCGSITVAQSDTLSSTFVPSFSKKGAPLSKFLIASQALESRWDNFIKRHPFISWIYAFDDVSGALRISPATATDMTYGRKMDFRQFEFYQSAKEKIPDVVWQDKPKEDVSGTGSILIVSTARKIDNGIKVISADIKVTTLERGSSTILNEVVVKRKTKSLLFFAYLKSENGLRSLISEYATDQAQWLSIRAFPSLNNNFLKIDSENLQKLLEVESKAEKTSNSDLVLEKMKLAENTYSCSVTRVKEPTVILWLCIE